MWQKLNKCFIPLSFLVVLPSSSLQCQLVKPYRCEQERIFANLFLSEATSISGTVKDTSGAPYTNGYKVDVRDVKSEMVVESTNLDSIGRFSLPLIQKGSFRFVIYSQKGDVVNRVPLMDQPENLVCHDSTVCKLDIVLKLHGTDQAFEFCRPR